MKVLIHEPDAFYRAGLAEYIKSLFDFTVERVSIVYNLRNADLTDIDIIMLFIHSGEQLTCFPCLCDEAKKIIVITERPVGTTWGLPWCFSEASFIHHREYLDSVGAKIVKKKREMAGSINFVGKKSCLNCKRRTLTSQQSMVMSLMSMNVELQEISEMLNIGIKTVYSHKNRVMSRFGLRTDSELLKLITALKDNSL